MVKRRAEFVRAPQAPARATEQGLSGLVIMSDYGSSSTTPTSSRSLKDEDMQPTIIDSARSFDEGIFPYLELIL